MKNKLILVLIVLLLFSGCNSKSNKKEVKIKANKIIDKDIEEKKETYVDTNPIKLSLYIDKKKANEYISPMTLYKDIVSLECYYTEDDSITNGRFKEVFNQYYNNYKDIDNYKIGYYIKFNTTDGEFSQYIYRPSDVESFFDYIQIYLYDDVHQESNYYSHVTNEEYNDNTLLTSIKLTASTYIDKVNSEVEVTAFTYKAEDINENKEYIGKSKYKVIIKRG
ncbi:MAG: hypothetical protein IKF19_03590 [Bacilli bacterium]|nr:hypothetical protein [Bacilli bacterium]